MDRQASRLHPLSMKAYPHRFASPFFIPGTPVVAIDFRSKYGVNSLSLSARRVRWAFRSENLSDRFRAAPGALVNADPRIFARVEARSRAVFVRSTRLGRLKE